MWVSLKLPACFSVGPGLQKTDVIVCNLFPHLLSGGNNASALGGFLRGLRAITVKLQVWCLAHHWYMVNAIHQYLWFVLKFLMHYTKVYSYLDPSTGLFLIQFFYTCNFLPIKTASKYISHFLQGFFSLYYSTYHIYLEFIILLSNISCGQFSFSTKS